MTARSRPGGRRGQLVVLAATVLAVAFVPLSVAYLQLGYHGDVGATAIDEQPLRAAERVLDRSLHDAVDGIPGDHAWNQRPTAVGTVRDRLDERLETLNRSRVRSGTVYEVTYNESRARAWARSNCPGGPVRQFGGCRGDRGIVVQERTGRVHVLAAAFDVRVTTAGGSWRTTTVVRVSR